jgi:hypothetical protein
MRLIDKDKTDFKLLVISIQKLGGGSIHFPKPISVKDSGFFFSLISKDPGVDFIKFLSKKIQRKGTNHIMIRWKVFVLPVKMTLVLNTIEYLIVYIK